MIGRLASDKRGASLIEFALVLPFLVTLYIGSYQVSDAISAYRKVTITTRALADLTSQATSVTYADLSSFLDASQQIMAPYKVSNARLSITQVKIDNDGNATVDWSCGKNIRNSCGMGISGLTPGSAFNLPANIKVAGTSLIVASVDYSYAPVAAGSIIGSIPMHDQIILSPRSSQTITLRTS